MRATQIYVSKDFLWKCVKFLWIDKLKNKNALPVFAPRLFWKTPCKLRTEPFDILGRRWAAAARLRSEPSLRSAGVKSLQIIVMRKHTHRRARTGCLHLGTLSPSLAPICRLQSGPFKLMLRAGRGTVGGRWSVCNEKQNRPLLSVKKYNQIVRWRLNSQSS